jgi:hypothetical protein
LSPGERDQVLAVVPEPVSNPLPWDALGAPVKVPFPRDSFVLCKRIPARTQRGDCLFHLGTDTGL